MTCSSTSRNGRYLLTEPAGAPLPWPWPFMATSPSASAVCALDGPVSLLEEDWGGDCEGYSQTALWL